MEKNKFKSIIEEVRFNNFINNLVKMNEESIVNVVSALDEETKARVMTVLEAKLPKPKAAVVKGLMDVSPEAQAKAQPGVDPKSDALDVKGPRPAADLKAGDMRSQFAKGPATDAGVAKADATFKKTSQDIGVRRAAEKSASANKYPTGEGLGNIKAKADTDLRTTARTDAEAKAKKDVTMNDTVKKVAKGLAGAGALGALGAGAVGVASLMDKSSTSTTGGGSNNLKPATVMADKPEFKFGSKKGGIVSAAELDKFRQHTGNKNVTLGQYMNARDKLTAVPGKANDPQQIMKSKNLGAADVYRPEQIKAGMAQRSGPAAPIPAGVNTPPNAQAALASKKLRKEDVDNPLINAFLQIQASGSSNLFEAAKKAKKDWDKDGKVESGTDEWKGSRDKAIKNKLKEGKDPFGKDVTSPSLMGIKAPDYAKPKKDVESKVSPKGDLPADVATSIERERQTNKEIGEPGSRQRSVIDAAKDAANRGGGFRTPEAIGKGVGALVAQPFAKAIDAVAGYKKPESKVMRNGPKSSIALKNEEFEELDEANPIAPVPDDYSGANGGVSKRDLSDETVAEGIRGMRRKDSKFKDDPKKYSNEYPKGYRAPGTMSKAEMRDHIEASVKKFLSRGGKVKKS